MKFILLRLLWGGRKIAQIGQTEPAKPISRALQRVDKLIDTLADEEKGRDIFRTSIRRRTRVR